MPVFLFLRLLAFTGFHTDDLSDLLRRRDRINVRHVIRNPFGRQLWFFLICGSHIIAAPQMLRRRINSNRPAIGLALLVLALTEIPHAEILLHLQPGDHAFKALLTVLAKTCRPLQLVGIVLPILQLLRIQIHDPFLLVRRLSVLPECIKIVSITSVISKYRQPLF